MAKAKRGKSGSASDLVRWDSELIKLPYTEDEWKPFIVFMIPSKSTDIPVVSLLSEIISSGLRKLFSVVEYDSLLEEVKELAASGKSVKGKVPVTTRPPQFLEVCEQAKMLMDQDEPITVSLLAKIVKFKMLMIKNKDIDRREAEKKLAMVDSKQRVESRSGSKGSARKSASPGKGKKGVKKEDPVPSPKKETQLKRRGEDGDDFKTIDDEPDDVTDPQHYIIITGFTDAHLLSHLIEMKVHIDVIINLDTDYHLRSEYYVLSDQIVSTSVDGMNSSDAFEMTIDHKDYQLKLAQFWDETSTLINNAPSGHHLHNVAKFDIFIDDNSLPDVAFDLLDTEKKNEFGLWLFNKLADVCYDLLDYYQQYKMYLGNLKIIDVSSEAYLGCISADSPDAVTTTVENEPEATHADTFPDVSPTLVDMRYYKHLTSYIPMETDSVPLLLNCMLEQVVATIDDGTQPMDTEPPERKDGLNHELGSYLDDKLAFYGLANNETNFWYNQQSCEVSPHIVYYGNKSGFRLCKFGTNDYLNPVEIENKLMSLHPYSLFKTYLQSSDEMVHSTVRHQKFYNFCNERYPICKEKFERAMRQYIFESLPIANNELVIEPIRNKDDDEELKRALQKWDDFYFNLLHSESSCAVVRENSGSVSAGRSASHHLDTYCCVETFSPSVLVQVLDEAHNLRPYVDTYYNHSNNTMLVVFQNPSNESLENSSNWNSWLHSDVGFRNYLEYVAIEIQDWVREQEIIEEQRSRGVIYEPETSVPVVLPPKEKSRWGMKTRTEMDKEEDKDDKRKKSGKRSQSPKKSASRSPQKKKLEKNARRSNSGKNHSISSTSKVSLLSEDIPPVSDAEKVYTFTGYNLNDDIIHISGDLTYMFPQDGSVIKIERMKYIQKNNYIQVSVLKQNGDVFAVNIVDPCQISDFDNINNNDDNYENDRNKDSHTDITGNNDNIDNNINNSINNNDGINNKNYNNDHSENNKNDNNNDNDKDNYKSNSNSNSPTKVDYDYNNNTNVMNSDDNIDTNNNYNNVKKDDNDNCVNSIDKGLDGNNGTDNTKNNVNNKRELSSDSVKEGKVNVLHTSNNSDHDNSLTHLPSLPCISGKTSFYTNIRATFADGMILVCSNSVNAPIERTEHIESEVSLENSDSAAPTEANLGKSAKPKTKKKDDDTKAQEETDKLQAIAIENEEKLQQRISDITKLTKEQEAVKNLYVTTQDALHVSFLHHASVNYLDSVMCKEATFFVKLEIFLNEVSKTSANGRIVSEMYRCIMEDGYVVQYLSDCTVRIVTPNGDILHSTPFKHLQHAIVSYNEVLADQAKPARNLSSCEPTKQGGRTSSLKSSKDIHNSEGGSSKSEYFDSVDWYITYSNGKQKIKKCDGSEEDIQSLMISDATCYETKEVLQTREDGVIIVRRPDGSTVVEYMDGTRITTFSEGKEIATSKTDLCSPCALNLVKIEHESMATVLVNKANMSISIIYGNNKIVKGMKGGGYIVSRNGVNEMVIDKNGNASVNPPHDISLSDQNSVELPQHKEMENNSCFFQQSSDECLCLTDNIGNKFTVNSFGEHNIEKKQQQQPLKPVILPRYFIIHSNGNGEELLHYDDVEDYIKQAVEDPFCAVFRTVVEGEDGGEAVTIIKPYQGPPSKIWQTRKSTKDIIPKSLRERDFKLFPPVEVKKDHPRMGTRIVVLNKEMKEDIKCPDILELRHITKYAELTPTVREQILKVISEYGEFLEEEQQMKDDLHNKEVRSEEEISIATRVKSEYMQEKVKRRSNESIIQYENNMVDRYMDAIVPPPPDPIPHAQPERSLGEWENDKIELEELEHARTVIRNRVFPKYMDTEEGQKFLLRNGMGSPDMDKLTKALALETSCKSPLKLSTPQGFSHVSQLESVPSDANSTPQLDDSSMLSMHSSTMSVQYNSSGNSETTFNSAEGKHNTTRPFNPTPLKQTEHQCAINESIDESKLEPVDENFFNNDSPKTMSSGKEMLRSRTHDVCGNVRKQLIGTPPSIRGSRPNAILNEKFSRIEGPVRRQVNTASIASLKGMKETTRLRGFVLIPDFVDFGMLTEGVGYSYQVTLKNVGIDTCRFKIKQPPPSTGLKVRYQPGPVAAGMSITFDIEIFAVAVGVDGSCGVGQVSHRIEIVTETDLLYFPVNATIVAQNDEITKIRCGGPSKGTLVLTHRPSSRETLTRPRRI